MEIHTVSSMLEAPACCPTLATPLLYAFDELAAVPTVLVVVAVGVDVTTDDDEADIESFVAVVDVVIDTVSGTGTDVEDGSHVAKITTHFHHRCRRRQRMDTTFRPLLLFLIDDGDGGCHGGDGHGARRWTLVCWLGLMVQSAEENGKIKECFQ